MYRIEANLKIKLREFCNLQTLNIFKVVNCSFYESFRNPIQKYNSKTCDLRSFIMIFTIQEREGF